MCSKMEKDFSGPISELFRTNVPHEERKYTLGESSVFHENKMSAMASRSYSLQIVQPHNKQAVIEFLRKFFLRDEPLNIETGMDLDYINGKTCPEIESYCTDSISEGNSVMALSESGDIVGVCLNGAISKEDANDDQVCENEKFRKVLLLLIEAARQTDIFSKYPNLERLLDVKIISVDNEWRGMGICKALLEKTIQLAKEQGFEMVKSDCTSHISALAVSRLGFERIHVLKYSEHFQGGNDTPVFNPPPPHWAVQVCIYKLDEVACRS